jgi:hypothetical protein
MRRCQHMSQVSWESNTGNVDSWVSAYPGVQLIIVPVCSSSPSSSVLLSNLSRSAWTELSITTASSPPTSSPPWLVSSRCAMSRTSVCKYCGSSSVLSSSSVSPGNVGRFGICSCHVAAGNFTTSSGLLRKSMPLLLHLFRLKYAFWL